MSGKSLQRKIDVAHRKISKVIGYPYNLYRPITNANVLDDSNLVAPVYLTATISDTYTSTIGWQLPIWTIYTDARLVQAGDFLYSDVEQRTFIVISRLPHLPILAIEANDRIDVKQVGYGNDDNGNYSPNATTYIARNLPCDMSYAAGSLSGGVPARSLGVAGIRQATIYTALPRERMAMGFIISHDSDNFSGNVVSYDYSSVGSGLRLSVNEFTNARAS